MSLIKTQLLEQLQLRNDVMSCLTDEDRETIHFLCNDYLNTLDLDDVGMTDEVLDLMEKLDLEYDPT